MRILGIILSALGVGGLIYYFISKSTRLAAARAVGNSQLFEIILVAGILTLALGIVFIVAGVLLANRKRHKAAQNIYYPGRKMEMTKAERPPVIKREERPLQAKAHTDGEGNGYTCPAEPAGDAAAFCDEDDQNGG